MELEKKSKSKKAKKAKKEEKEEKSLLNNLKAIVKKKPIKNQEIRVETKEDTELEEKHSISHLDLGKDKMLVKEDSIDVKETLPEKQTAEIQQPTESTYSSSFDFIKEHHKIKNKEELERKFNTLSTERKKDLVERTEGPYMKLKSQFDYYIENSKMMKEDYSSLQESLDSFLKILSNEEQEDVAIEQTDETSPKKNLSSKLKEKKVPESDFLPKHKRNGILAVWIHYPFSNDFRDSSRQNRRLKCYESHC